MAKPSLKLVSPLESKIVSLRQNKIILDSDLAELYGVTVKRLNEQVKRNRERFPADFVFQLTAKENQNLRSQIATSNRGGRRYRPYAFTEHGAIMAANVLNSRQAVRMSVFVVRAFVRLREMLSANRELAAQVGALEQRMEKQDATIEGIIEAMNELMQPEEASGRKIGFQLPAAKP